MFEQTKVVFLYPSFKNGYIVKLCILKYVKLEMKDVLIIGAGPIGLACGIEAQKHGLSYTIIEKGVLVNSLYRYPDKMTFFSTSEKLEIGGVPFVSHNPKPTRQEALEYYRRVAEKYELEIRFYEEVVEIKKQGQEFYIKTSKAEHHAQKVVIASGFYDISNKLDVPGEELPKVRHYYNDPHPYFRQKVAVIGAQNSAVDAALECWRKGAEVTLIHRGPGIAERVKYWVRPDIENRIKEGSIKAFFNATVKEITDDTISFMQDRKLHTIDNDFVLAMTGYQPNFDFLQQMGVKLNDDSVRKPHYDHKTMESNVEGLYLAGVIVGGMETAKWFIENSRLHAEIIFEEIAKEMHAT